MEEERKNNYLLGIVVSLIGAIIGTIPWILVYVYANMIYSLLAIIVAVASYYGYKITKAKIDKKLPIIIVINSFIAITIATLVVIPMLLLIKEGVNANLTNLSLLYSDSSFKTAILGDYVISLLFTVLGISGVIATLKKQIAEGKDANQIKIMGEAKVNGVDADELETVKSIFIDNEATNKNKVISEGTIIEDLNIKANIEEERANQIIKILKAQNIIRKSSGGYYFSEKAEKSKLNRTGKTTIIIIAIIVIVITILTVLGMSSSKKEQKQDNNYLTEYNFKENNIKFVPTNDIMILTEEEIEEYFYEGASKQYEFIAADYYFTKIIYCFTVEKADYDANMTVEDFYKYSLNEENLNIQTKNIGGKEFSFVRFEKNDETNQYIEDCYVYETEDKFICFDYLYKQGMEDRFEEMIK